MTADSADVAAHIALEGLAPMFGLQVDATRAEWLKPLVASLLRHGDRLTQTADPAVEPTYIGATT